MSTQLRVYEIHVQGRREEFEAAILDRFGRYDFLGARYTIEKGTGTERDGTQKIDRYERVVYRIPTHEKPTDAQMFILSRCREFFPKQERFYFAEIGRALILDTIEIDAILPAKVEKK